ncbi:rodlin [Streptomyces sp. NPDC001793]|uniref:rodlin n=1 Tax=Streptomyces sp. NPDC001793 TaxID=3154657 RepID=UPI003320E31D
MNKMMAAAAIAASLVGISAAAAPEALAAGGEHGGVKTVNGNGAKSVYGNSRTKGKLSTQLGLFQGSLNDLCIGLPAKGNFGSLVGFVPVTVQDINVLSSPQNQQCTENSTQAKRDEALSHILDDDPILSGNGIKNGFKSRMKRR